MEQGKVGGYVDLLRQIKGKNFSKLKVQRLFNKIVPKEDYLIVEKRELVDYALKYGLTT